MDPPSRRRSWWPPLLAATGVLASPSLAWAVQAHAGGEGLVAHEIAHLLFAASCLFLLWRLRRSDTTGRGWRELKAFLWLLTAWNVLTFSGHWQAELMDPSRFVEREGRVVGFAVASFSDAYFYLTRLDHLLLAPAFLLLVAALRKWRAEP
jgi:hypothetical protein